MQLRQLDHEGTEPVAETADETTDESSEQSKFCQIQL